MSDVGIDKAHATELPAVLVTIQGVVADGMTRFVHECAVSDSHHVPTHAWVDGRAVLFVGGVPAVVVPVTPPGGIDTTSVGAGPVSGSVTNTGQLIRGVRTVIVSVTFPAGVYTSGTVSTTELIGCACAGAVPLVPIVPTVVVSIAYPSSLDAQIVVALHLTGWTI